MKRILSFILALSLITTTFQNVVTLIAFSINHDYIVSTYCVSANAPENMCGGSCYLSNELADFSKNSDQAIVNFVKLENLVYQKSESIQLETSPIEVDENPTPNFYLLLENLAPNAVIAPPPKLA